MEEESYQLPEDCWERVFNFLHEDHHRYLESLSIVSKKFLSITNYLRSSLKLCDQTHPRVLHRFPSITSIDLRHCRQNNLDMLCRHRDLDALLIEISRSPLQLKSLNLSNHPRLPSNGLRALAKKMKSLKSLICSNLGYLTNTDMLLISECYPFLEELDLSFPKDSCGTNMPYNFTQPLSDFGVKALSLDLPNLKKINLSGNGFINDESLFSLCKNCENLQEIVILHCPSITQDGIALAIRERPNLNSISLMVSGDFTSFIESLVNLKGLTCLDLSSSSISDKLLYSIAEKCLSLRKLVFQYCSGSYTYAGMFSLLSKCQLLQHLDLENAEYLLNDRRVNKLSQIFRGLVYINLSGCSMITELALYALLRNCPFISEIRMERTGIGGKGVYEDSNMLMDSIINTQVKSLYLGCNSSLVDESIIKIIASICPNLQLLTLTGCNRMSTFGEGVIEVLKRCCKIRHLVCFNLRQFVLNFEVSKLEVLSLARSKIGDDVLSLISKNCCGLLELDLSGCMYVTTKGVRKVVEKCTQLRKLDLGNCQAVDASVVDWMIFSRPSLRKITAPPSFHCKDSQREFLVRNGCLVLFAKVKLHGVCVSG